MAQALILQKFNFDFTLSFLKLVKHSMIQTMISSIAHNILKEK